MEIWLNDKPVQLSDSATLEDALHAFDFIDGTFAVAINQEFIPRSNYASTQLTESDKIDIVTPMQGG